MELQSARFSGDPVLTQCLNGAHRMFEPEENLSVMRVQEALRRLDFDPGPLDGIFGGATGTAVTKFKQEHNLSPSDPVVGVGTSGTLDSLLFHNPPILDPDFGEVAPFVAAHSVEPFVGLTLAPLIDAPLNSQRHDVGRSMLTALGSGHCLAMVAGSRAGDVPDPRIPADVKAEMVNLGPASGTVRHFTGTDGLPHVVMVIDDLTIRGKRFLVHRPTLRKVKIDLRGTLCHELTHIRNSGLGLENTPDFDVDTFLDPNLANAMSNASGRKTAAVFAQFAHEMNARHNDWMIEQEAAGNPFAAQFLQPVELSEAAHFYFAESDREFYFQDNGYIGAILARGHQAIYQQMALWLRQCANMTFSGDPARQAVSAQLFRDAADSAELTALNPGLLRPPGNGLYPVSTDFT
jgi:Putative peptidoglycan binding domain